MLQVLGAVPLPPMSGLCVPALDLYKASPNG